METKEVELHTAIHIYRDIFDVNGVCLNILDGEHGMSGKEWLDYYDSLEREDIH